MDDEMHTKRILIVTDDSHTRGWIDAALTGLDAELAACDLAQFERRMIDGAADLVLLDAGLRPAPLIGTAERAFARGAEARMLLIVDLGGLSTLSLPARGAIDFLVRGGSSEELGIRVRHLLWPGEEANSDDIVQRDGLTLNLATYQAMIDGEPVDFAYLEYALFAFLVTHPGRTYSREALLSRVWGTDYYGGSRTVDVHVRRIRAKLGPEHSRRLETVRNVGYLWNG